MVRGEMVAEFICLSDILERVDTYHGSGTHRGNGGGNNFNSNNFGGQIKSGSKFEGGVGGFRDEIDGG